MKITDCEPEDYPGCLDILVSVITMLIVGYFLTFGWKYIQQAFNWVIGL